MMTWRDDAHHHHILDRWRVSSLIHAFLELILALCVFLCAIISVTTTRIIKSSGLFHQTCVSCDIQHHQRRQGSTHIHDGGDAKGYPELDSCDPPGNRGCSGNRDSPTPLNIICEDCPLCLSDCAFTSRQGTLADSTRSPVRCRNNVVTGLNENENSNENCGSDPTIWAIDDDDSCRQKRLGGSCSSFENNDSSCDGSERIVNDGTTVAAGEYGYESPRCIGIPGGSTPPSRSSGRAVKRKFAKEFPDDWRGASYSSYCCGHPAHGFADSPSLIFSEGGGPAEIGEIAGDDGVLLVHTDGSSRFLSNGSDAQFAPEDSVRASSQESFSYKTRPSSARGLLRCAEVSRNRSKLSIDTDLLGGESTPEWCESLADSPVVGNGKDTEEEQEAGSALEHEDDPEINVMELREALQEEKDTLAAVYLELEEERNAASSAAHEAMAMMSRLQEEKAAIQMEARQYQRMAEEKHQYDQESMAMLQEILVRRDEEVYALEEELNLYRNKLLNLGMDEMTMDRSVGARDRVGSPKRGNDVLLIERETLLLEGSEDWKNGRTRSDQNLLAEIKKWLNEAREKVVAPLRIEELKNPSGNSNRLLPGSERKNLLESFSSAVIEDSERDGMTTEEFGAHRDGVVNEKREAHRDEALNEELETHRRDIANEEPGIPNRDTAAGYESLMESLRREPNLRDEESLKTLKKIEEKFHRQSFQGEVTRTGDELRQIWKNTLRSIESDERDTEAHEAGAEGAEPRDEGPTTAIEPPTTSNSPDHNEAPDAAPVDTDRTVEEKRMSVLEYVWKFEEQLHQLGNKKPALPGKPGSFTAIESLAETTPESKGESSESIDSDKNNKKSHWARLRKLATGGHAISSAADGRTATPDAEGDHFVVRGEPTPSSERATTSQDDKLEKSSDVEEGSSQDVSSVVHDIYEVQQDPRDLLTEESSHGRNEKRFSDDVKRYVSSTVNDLVPGQFIDSHETARCEEHYAFDSGRPDFVVGHTLKEHEAHGKGRPDQSSSTGNFSLSVKEPGMCSQDQDDGWPEDCMDMSIGADGCNLQSPSSAVTDKPGAQMQDVVQYLTHRLRALETDRQVTPGTIVSLKRENGEMKILQDIAPQLRELRGEMEQTALNNTDTWPLNDPAFDSSIKRFLQTLGGNTMLSRVEVFGPVTSYTSLNCHKNYLELSKMGIRDSVESKARKVQEYQPRDLLDFPKGNIPNKDGLR